MMMSRRISAALRALCLAYAAFALCWVVGGTAPSFAQTCGNDMQAPCLVEKVRIPCYKSCRKRGRAACGACYYDINQCNSPNNYVNDQGVCSPLPTYTIPSPSQVSIEDKGQTVSAGYYVKIDLKQAWIVIPNLQQPTSCKSNPEYQSPTAIVVPDPNDPTVPTFATSAEYRVRLTINASYFEVIDVPKSYPKNNWHSWVCTTVFGYTLSNKSLVQKEQQLKVYIQGGGFVNVTPATLVFYTSQAAQEKGRQAEIKQYPMFPPDDPSEVPAEYQNAVSGIPLLTDGNYVGDSVAEPEPTHQVPRTAAGLSADGNTLILVVVNPGSNDEGVTLASLAGYIKSLGAQNAINLDGGGSSQLYYNVPGETPIRTKPSDYINERDKKLYYRPVGNMLGIR